MTTLIKQCAQIIICSEICVVFLFLCMFFNGIMARCDAVMFEVTYVGPLYGKLKQDVPEQALICHFLPFHPAERTWTNNRISKRHS